MIQLNLVKANLPYIFIPELNANFLVDTGSTRSLMNPNLAYKFYQPFIFKEDFQIQTAHNISYHDEVMIIPIFEIFKVPENHKFYLFKFSGKYDGLVGIDFLKQIKANVNIDSKIITTPRVTIPIIYETEEYTKLKQTLKINKLTLIIPPRSEKVVKLPVKYSKGVGLLNYIKYGNKVESPQAIVNIENHFAITTIINSNTNPAKIEINEPFDVELLNINELNFIGKMEVDSDESFSQNQDNILKSNLRNLRLDHCNLEEKQAIRDLCLEYRDIFYCDKIPLTFTSEIQHKINLTDETPIFTKTYRYPEIHKQEVKDQVEKMLQQGIIQNSISPWSSPIWIVPKKADASGKKKWRMVIDYRKLNERTIDDKYPLPNIADILDKLGRSQYFTTLDLANGFHQIQMDPNDIQKTAFSTENGHFEFKRMPFGLKNSPSTFQRIMDNILRGIQNETCLVYLDDIVIFSTSLQEHLERLRAVFDRLRKANFKIQLDKSEFLRKEVSYLGHVITPNGVKPNADKIDAIKKFPIPKTQKEIKSFLGLVGYYRKFIKDFAKITKPLTKCLKKNSSIKHDEEFVSAFNTCKTLLINAPILQYPDFSKKFILTTDASSVAIGAILSQGPIGQDRPIAFASRTLNESEQRYSTIERELLSIVWACKYFRPYLFGRKFTIYCDHRPLIFLFKLREPNSKLVRWRLKLEEFDYDIVYKKGKLNTNADALSRITINALENESIINNPGEINSDILDYLRNCAENPIQHDPEPQKPESSNSESDRRNPKIKILQDIRLGPSDVTENDNATSTQHSTCEETTNKGIQILEEIINNKVNQILVFPHPYFKLDVKQENYEHHKILTVKLPQINNEDLIFQFLRDYTISNKAYYVYFHNDPLYKQFNKVCLAHFSESGPRLVRCTKRVNTVSDKEEQIILTKNHHEGKTNHRGINETLEHLQRNYYWINMKSTITNHINCCEICQRTKYARKKPYTPLMLTETATKPFQLVHIDTFTYNNKNYLTLVDSFTKFAQAYYIVGKTAIEISKVLIKYFISFGIPENLILDNGTEFNNDTVKEILNLHNIKIHFTTPRHHESNSIVERFHSTIIEHLRILKEKFPDETDNLMDYAILGYNSSIHSATNFTPFELTFGHTNSRSPNEIFMPISFYSEYAANHKQKLEHVYEQVNESLKIKKEKVIDKKNSQGNTSQEFYLGQTVYKQNPSNRNKKHNKFLGPYEITEVLERNRVEITNKQNINKKEIIHIKELRKPTFVAGSSPTQQVI